MERKHSLLYLVTTKNSLGQYKTFEKFFSDEKHLENWTDFVWKRFNFKVIGYELKP
jgi:hypothetical protein